MSEQSFKPSIKDAMELVRQATRLLLTYEYYRTQPPTDEEWALFRQLERKFWLVLSAIRDIKTHTSLSGMRGAGL